MSMEDVIEKYEVIGCLWKKVADNDKNKAYVTFSPDALCHKCTGHNLACKNYTPMYKIKDEK